MVHPVQNFLQLVHCPLPRNHPLWDGLAENCCILWLRGNFKHCCSITMKQRNKRTCFSPCWKQLEIFKNPKNNIFNIKILLLLTETYVAIITKCLLMQVRTRWTFFRVKLVFECEFEISWSLGPWDLGTPGPWNPWTLGLLDLFPLPAPPHTSPYMLLPSHYCGAKNHRYMGKNDLKTTSRSSGQ